MAAANTAPTTLQQAILFFSVYEHCRKAVESIRWPDGTVVCPNCGSERVTYLEKQRRYKCYETHPRAQFSLKVGTVFEDSAIGLEKWLPALWLLTNCKSGISSYELARALGVTQKTAWFMLSRLRLALQSTDGGKLSGEVEVDDTYIGGKARNMHAEKRKRLGFSPRRSMINKVAVMGLLERHGDGSKVRTLVLSGRKTNDFQPRVREHVEPGSMIHTDAHLSYQGLRRDYIHKSSTTPRRTSMATSTPTDSTTSGRCSSAPSRAPMLRWSRSICFATSTNRRFVSISVAGPMRPDSRWPSRASSASVSPTLRLPAPRFQKRAEKAKPQLRRGRRARPAR